MVSTNRVTYLNKPAPNDNGLLKCVFPFDSFRENAIGLDFSTSISLG